MKELVAKVKLPADAEAYRCLADIIRLEWPCRAFFVFMYMWVQVNLPADQMLNIHDSCKYYQK